MASFTVPGHFRLFNVSTWDWVDSMGGSGVVIVSIGGVGGATDSIFLTLLDLTFMGPIPLPWAFGVINTGCAIESTSSGVCFSFRGLPTLLFGAGEGVSGSIKGAIGLTSFLRLDFGASLEALLFAFAGGVTLLFIGALLLIAIDWLGDSKAAVAAWIVALLSSMGSGVGSFNGSGL